MSYRSRKHELAYKKYLKKRRKAGKAETCIFCDPEEWGDVLVEEGKHFRIIKNKFPYTAWDTRDVADHLLIVPKEHTDQITNMPPAAHKEFFELASKYEDAGYDLFARAPGSKGKSIIHQHTHLIKPDGKIQKFFVYSKKPYIRISV